MQSYVNGNPLLKAIAEKFDAYINESLSAIESGKQPLPEESFIHSIIDMLGEDGINDFKNSESGETLLIDAITEGYDISLISTLLNAGASIYKHNYSSPMHALLDSERTDKLQIAELLIDRNNKDIKHHKTTIIIANVQDSDNFTPLHKAASDEDFALCKLLISKGRADINIQELSGDTPIDLAPKRLQNLLSDLHKKVNSSIEARSSRYGSSSEITKRDKESFKNRDRDSSPSRGGNGSRTPSH